MFVNKFGINKFSRHNGLPVIFGPACTVLSEIALTIAQPQVIDIASFFFFLLELQNHENYFTQLLNYILYLPALVRSGF